MNTNNLIRALLILFLGPIGSIIINNTGLKPEGYTCRTAAHWVLLFVTCGIYTLVAAIAALLFDASKESIIGFKKD